MPRKRQTGAGGLYPVKVHGCGRIGDQWTCGAKPSECPRAVISKWVGVVDIGFNERGGRKQARVSAKSQTVARQKLDKLIGEVRTHGSPLGNQTVAEWGASWLNGIKYNKPQTYRTYHSLMTTWILPVIGRKNVKDVRPSDLRQIYDNMKRAGRSSSSALKAHTVMSSMFESARLEKLTPINVASDLRPPKAAKTTRDTLEPDETRRVLDEARHVRDGAKWLVALSSGMRQGERLGATIDSVDWERRLFTVRWNLVEGNYEHGCDGRCGKRAAGHCPLKQLIIPEVSEYRQLNGRYMLVPPKSGEPRTFSLPPDVWELLESQTASLSLRPNPFGLLWPAEDGAPVAPRDDQAEWKALLIAAEVDKPQATTHWARHTYISDASAAGVADRTIGETVGHKSPGVTGRYEHVSSLDAQAAMEKLAQRRQIVR